VRRRLIEIAMLELASYTVWTVEIFMIPFAWFCLIVFRNVGLAIELLGSMSEGARIIELALASELPVFAHFSLVLSSEALNVPLMVLFVFELFPRLFNKAVFIEF
jgi:hypothetical protein